MSSITHIKRLAREMYREGSFLSYLDMMKRIPKSRTAGYSTNKFCTQWAAGRCRWCIANEHSRSTNMGYVYNACEGLDCSNRTSVNGKEGTRVEPRDPLNMEGVIRELSRQERKDAVEDEIYKIREQQAVCYYCKKPGHFKRECRKRMADRKGLSRQVNTYPEQNWVREESDITNKRIQNYTVLNNINKNRRIIPELTVAVHIDDKRSRFLVDTGSTTNLIKSCYVRGNVERSKVRLRAANGTEITVIGKKRIVFKIGGEIL
ncbi:hypothetical protein NGRA_2251 [Nosema granulosis]|uniref:CCHC-type domain-containing protein n=1 Tax=Nosema granulosis TaxID=83296 RepID=A0A9P6H089_9MICR|nr:hypothetical protein NGRA_2251 [Nosema granulosis]